MEAFSSKYLKKERQARTRLLQSLLCFFCFASYAKKPTLVHLPTPTQLPSPLVAQRLQQRPHRRRDRDSAGRALAALGHFLGHHGRAPAKGSNGLAELLELGGAEVAVFVFVLW